MSGQEKPKSAWLIALCGPGEREIELRAKESGITIGRHEQCEIRLPADTVSRFHARLRFESDGWRIADLKSRWGTFLNGCRLDSGGAEMPLKDGDLIRITPWTFTFTCKARARSGIASIDDLRRMQTMVRSVGAESSGGAMADDLLALLLESAAGMHAANDEQELAEIMLEAAVRGTALPNGAVLRPLDADGRIEVVASRRSPSNTTEGPAYSRALLAAACSGSVAELSPMNAPLTSESIVQMRIETAICVPLMLGSAVAAYLYLDSRGEKGLAALKMRPNATAFCVGLGRIAGLALANLKRIDIERRQAMIEAELAAGVEAQRWILPQRQDRIGKFTYVGESRPGRGMGGDFFDVIQLDENRVAVAVGDVSGKGIAASVLMTATQGFLHAALKEHGLVEKAVTDLNRFVMPRRPIGKFITMWVGVFDAKSMTLTYVDAGHGYGIMIAADRSVRPLSSEDGMPVGIAQDAAYTAETVPLAADARVLVISDGIAEQPAASEGTAPRRPFGMAGVNQCLATLRPGDDEVGRLFAAVREHAATSELADDATVVVVKW